MDQETKKRPVGRPRNPNNLEDSTFKSVRMTLEDMEVLEKVRTKICKAINVDISKTAGRIVIRHLCERYLQEK